MSLGTRANCASYHFGFAKGRDLARAEAEFGEHFVGVLAELGRRLDDRARRARSDDRLADHGHLAAVLLGYVLGDAEMLHLLISEHLIDGIDRPGRHTGL